MNEPEYIDLATLDKDAFLRNEPLGKISAQCKFKPGKQPWKTMDGWNIAKVPYNSLGKTWLEYYDFRAPKETNKLT